MSHRQNHPNAWSRGYQNASRPYLSEWFLLQKTGTLSFRLTTSDLILIGREKCDINIQSPSVEKRHAVLCFDTQSECFTVRDLKTTNGTFLNNQRIGADRPEKLKNMDLLRFGFDPNFYELRSTIGNNTVAGSAASENHEKLTGGPCASVNSSPLSDHDSNVIPERFSHVMQGHRGNSLGGSRVSSPSLTLDSGHGSSSAPSSPAKEMSPVPNSTSSNTTSPQFHRRMKPSDIYRRNSYKISSEVMNSVLLDVNGERNPTSTIRKDSLEDETEDNAMIPKLTAKDREAFHGSLEPDISVPNEVFQPQEEHTKIDSCSTSSTKTACLSNTSEVMSRSRSFSGGGSSALSPLYGTPHWWPEPDEENFTIDANENEHNNHFHLHYKSPSEPKDVLHTDSVPERVDGGDSSVSSEKDQSLKSDSESVGSKKMSPMAFTVDFGATNTNSAATKKIFGIADSISKFAPRHKRNYSLTKVEELSGKDKDSPVAAAKKEKETTTTSQPKSHHRKSSLGTESTIQKSSVAASGSKLQVENTTHFNGDTTTTTTITTTTTTTTTPTAVPPTRRPLHELPIRKLKTCKPKTAIMPISSLPKQQQVPKVVPATAVVKDICNNDLSVEINSLSLQVVEADECKEVSDSDKVNTVSVEVDDTTSETGTYTIEKDAPEVQKARKNIDNVFGMESPSCASATPKVDNVEKCNNSVGTGTPGWIREWAELAAQQHQKEDCVGNNELHPVSETQFFLLETENLVSAMQERVRVSQRLSNNNSTHNSDSEDEAAVSRIPKSISKIPEKKHPVLRTSPMLREASVLSDSGYALGYQSDSSNEGSRDFKNMPVKYNKAFSIRRNRVVGYESDGCATVMNRQSMTLPVRGVSPRPQTGNSRPTPPALMMRSDGGRFSLRMPKSKSPVNQMAPPPTVVSGNKANVCKSDLGVSKKPQPPVGMNRKPPVGSRSNSTLTAKEVELANWKRRKNYDPMKAAAESKKGGNGSGKKPQSGTDSAPEEPVPISRFVPNNHRSGQGDNNNMTMMKSTSFHEGYSGLNSEDEDIMYVVDEMESTHSNSPNHLVMTRSLHEEGMYYGLSHPSLRPKNKLEALDNLVIATIHSLSVKVRTASRKLLEKLQVQHANDENGALLEEMVSQLKDLEALSNTSSPNKSPSRELSGTLKNLKKMEQVVLVLDRVLCDDLGSDLNA